MVNHHFHSFFIKCISVFLTAVWLLSVSGQALAKQNLTVKKAKVIEHWTFERRQAAIPRDLYLDQQGRGFMSDGRGGFTSYGSGVTVKV